MNKTFIKRYEDVYNKCMATAGKTFHVKNEGKHYGKYRVSLMGTEKMGFIPKRIMTANAFTLKDAYNILEEAMKQDMEEMKKSL